MISTNCFRSPLARDLFALGVEASLEVREKIAAEVRDVKQAKADEAAERFTEVFPNQPMKQHDRSR